MMRSSRITSLHPRAKEVFYATEYEGRMIDGIDLGAEKRGRHLRQILEILSAHGECWELTCLAKPLEIGEYVSSATRLSQQ